MKMKETAIRIKAQMEYENKGYSFWYARRVSFQECDVFGVFDGLAFRGKKRVYLQWTTAGNIGARKKKIEAFLKKDKIIMAGNEEIHILGWDKKKKDFKVVKLC